MINHFSCHVASNYKDGRKQVQSDAINVRQRIKNAGKSMILRRKRIHRIVHGHSPRSVHWPGHSQIGHWLPTSWQSHLVADISYLRAEEASIDLVTENFNAWSNCAVQRANCSETPPDELEKFRHVLGPRPTTWPLERYVVDTNDLLCPFLAATGGQAQYYVPERASR